MVWGGWGVGVDRVEEWCYLVVEVRRAVGEVAVRDEDVQALVGRELGHPALHHLLEDEPVFLGGGRRVVVCVCTWWCR